MVRNFLFSAVVYIANSASDSLQHVAVPVLNPVEFKPIDAKELESRSTEESTSSSVERTPDISDSVRERIEADSKRVGKIAESLVGVQGDINRVEKEVLGKVFDMSSM